MDFVDLFIYDIVRSMVKHSIGHAVLEVLADVGEVTLDNFFSRKYSYARMWRSLLGLERSRNITRQTVSTILWRLKRQGLVERIGAKKTARWQLTSEGKEHLQEKASGIEKVYESDGITRLVIFDIPEKERRKRDMVRAELIACDFRQFQKSVWIGEHPLPECFITLLDDFQLAGKIHIFSVREYGTTSRLK